MFTFLAGITAPSPLQEYAEALHDVDDAKLCQALEALGKIQLVLPEGTEELGLSGTGFYAIQSCMNHSCQPNAHAMQSELEAKSFAVIAAKQHIAAGEEVTISYIDETLPYSERQEALQDYGFQCRCPLCEQQQ